MTGPQPHPRAHESYNAVENPKRTKRRLRANQGCRPPGGAVLRVDKLSNQKEWSFCVTFFVKSSQKKVVWRGPLSDGPVASRRKEHCLSFRVRWCADMHKETESCVRIEFMAPRKCWPIKLDLSSRRSQNGGKPSRQKRSSPCLQSHHAQTKKTTTAGTA